MIAEALRDHRSGGEEEARVTPNDPRHGTHAGYVAGCRGECCTTAKRRDDKRRAIRRMHHGPLMVDASRARAHLTNLQGWGVVPWWFRNVGVSHARDIAEGRRACIHRTTEDRILAVVAEPGVNCWPAHGAVRRVQALIALGHSQTVIAAEMGVLPSYLTMLLNGTRGWQAMRPETWQSIADAYERLSMVLGDSTRSRRRAARHGWVVPLAWDNIDDPAEKPKGVAERPPKKYAGRADAIREAVERGDTVARVCADLGIGVDALEKWCKRNGHGDLWERLWRRSAA